MPPPRRGPPAASALGLLLSLVIFTPFSLAASAEQLQGDAASPVAPETLPTRGLRHSERGRQDAPGQREGAAAGRALRQSTSPAYPALYFGVTFGGALDAGIQPALVSSAVTRALSPQDRPNVLVKDAYPEDATKAVPVQVVFVNGGEAAADRLATMLRLRLAALFPAKLFGDAHLEFLTATTFLVQANGSSPSQKQGLSPALFFTASFGNCTAAEFLRSGRRATYVESLRTLLPGADITTAVAVEHASSTAFSTAMQVHTRIVSNNLAALKNSMALISARTSLIWPQLRDNKLSIEELSIMLGYVQLRKTPLPHMRPAPSPTPRPAPHPVPPPRSPGPAPRPAPRAAPPPRLAIQLLEHSATGPTQAFLAATPVSGANLYTFSLVPVAGGRAIQVASKQAFSIIKGLTAGATYSTTVTATVPGKPSMTSAPKTTQTPAKSAPWLVTGTATSATTATVSASPPAVGGPWAAWVFTAKPAGGGPAVVATCPTPTCDVRGLEESTEYNVTLVAKSKSNLAVAASNTLLVRTPSSRAAIIVSVSPASPTVAWLSARSKTEYVQYKFIVALIGQPTATKIEVISASPDAIAEGLVPGMRYTATIVGISPLGKQAPLGNDIVFTTPEAGAPTLSTATPNGPTTASLSATPPPVWWTLDSVRFYCHTPERGCRRDGLLPNTNMRHSRASTINGV